MIIILVSSLFLSLSHATTDVEFVQSLKEALKQDTEFQNISNLDTFYKRQYQSGISKFALPTATLSYGRTRDKSVGAESETEYNSGSLSLNYSLFHFGADLATLNSFKHDLRTQKNNKQATLVKREAEVGEQLLRYIRDYKNLEIHREVLDIRKKALDVSKKRYKLGTLSQVDLYKIEIDYARAQSDFVNAQNNFFDIQAVVDAYRLTHPLKEFPWRNLKDLQKVFSVRVEAQETPHYQLYYHQSESASELAASIKRNMFGNFQLSYSTSIYNPDQSVDQSGYQVALVYTIPLFNSLTEETQYQQVRATARTYETTLSYQKKFIDRDIEAKKRKLETSFENFQRNKKMLKLSNSLFESSIKQFRVGKISVNELSIEQDRLLNVKQIANQSQYQFLVDFLLYTYTVGKSVTEGQISL